jgi:hypothetical protein
MPNVFIKLAVAKIIFILAVFCAPVAYAGWAADVRYVSNTQQYFAKVTYWDTGDTTPNPLYGCTYLCYITIYISTDKYNGAEMSKMTFKEITTSKTLGELAQNFAKAGYLNREVSSLQGFGNKEVCIFFGHPARYPGGSYGPGIFPGGMNCIPPVIDPNYCDIAEKQIELNHGMLLADQVNGNTVSTSLRVKCSYTLPVRIMSSDRVGSIYFNSGNRFRSELKIDGESLGEGKVLDATPQGSELTLSSTLMGYDGSIGVFQGSKTIIVSLP